MTPFPEILLISTDVLIPFAEINCRKILVCVDVLVLSADIIIPYICWCANTLSWDQCWKTHLCSYATIFLWDQLLTNTISVDVSIRFAETVQKYLSLLMHQISYAEINCWRIFISVAVLLPFAEITCWKIHVLVSVDVLIPFADIKCWKILISIDVLRPIKEKYSSRLTLVKVCNCPMYTLLGKHWYLHSAWWSDVAHKVIKESVGQLTFHSPA